MALFRIRPHFESLYSLKGGTSRLQTTAATSTPGYSGFSKLWQPARTRERHFSCLQAAISQQQPKTFLLCLKAHHFKTCSSVHTLSGRSLSAQAQENSSRSAAQRKGSEHGSVLMQFAGTKKEDPKQLTVGAKAVQAGKDVSWVLVIIGGFAITGFLLWSIGSEFLSGSSPSTIFTKALTRVKSDPRVIEALGEPITGHGETSGRGRRRDIANQEYEVDGVTYMRVKFYVDGSRRKGTVYLDLKRNDQGKYECRFLFVELKGYPPQTIVLEDNR